MHSYTQMHQIKIKFLLTQNFYEVSDKPWLASLAMEKEIATHSSVLAWRIPGTGEPGGLPSLRSQSRTRLKQLSSSSSSSFPCGWDSKEYACNARVQGPIPGSGRSPGMTIHSSILAWRIPWTEEPGGLQSLGSQSQTWLSEWHSLNSNSCEAVGNLRIW